MTPTTSTSTARRRSAWIAATVAILTAAASLTMITAPAQSPQSLGRPNPEGTSI